MRPSQYSRRDCCWVHRYVMVPYMKPSYPLFRYAHKIHPYILPPILKDAPYMLRNCLKYQ